MSINIVDPFWQQFWGWGCIGTILVLCLLLVFRGYGRVAWNCIKGSIVLWLVLGATNLAMMIGGDNYMTFKVWFEGGLIFCSFLGACVFIFLGFILHGGKKIEQAFEYAEWKEEELNQLEQEHSALRGYQRPYRVASRVVEENPLQLPEHASVPFSHKRFSPFMDQFRAYWDNDSNPVSMTLPNGVRAYRDKDAGGNIFVELNGKQIYYGSSVEDALQSVLKTFGRRK